MANPYNLSDAEMKQISAMSAAANQPNINLMAGMISGDPGVSNMASQAQAGITRGKQAEVGALRSALAAKAGRTQQAEIADARQARGLEASAAAAKLKRDQELADAKRDRAWETADMAAKQRDAIELQKLKNTGKLSQARKAEARLTAARQRAEFQWAKGQKPDALSATQEKAVSDMVRNLESIQRVAKNFTPEFQANIGMIGELQNTLAREFGPMVQRFAPEWEDQAAWHRDYQRHLSLPERHEFFGATLTQGEQTAWKQAEVGPGVSPEAMRKNLEERTQILMDVVTRRATAIARSRRNPNAVEDLVGGVIPDFDLPEGFGQQPFPTEIYESGEAAGEISVEDMTEEQLRALADEK